MRSVRLTLVQREWFSQTVEVPDDLEGEALRDYLESDYIVETFWENEPKPSGYIEVETYSIEETDEAPDILWDDLGLLEMSLDDQS